MDCFYSVKNTVRVPLNKEDAELAQKIQQRFSISIINALSAAVAIHNEVDELHSCYEDFQNSELQEYLKTHGVTVVTSRLDEAVYPEDELEHTYSNFLAICMERSLHLV